MKVPAELFNQGKVIVEQNASTILTAVGVVGTVSTAVLTGRASFKAAQIIDDDQRERLTQDNETESTIQEKVKLVWPLYVPPVGVCVATVAAIVMSNRISTTRAAALAAAYGVSEKRLSEYKSKVAEKFGDNKATAVRDEIAQDEVNRNPPPSGIVIISGEVLCKDAQTGQFSTASVEKIHQRLNELNDELINHNYASVAWFFEPFGVEATNVTNELGWNHSNDGLIDIVLSTVMAKGDRPCVVVDFNQQPHLNYNIRSYS